MISDARIAFHDLAPGEESFRDAVLKGLGGTPKSIPCKFFYDARGSALFEAICRLPEYYPTRTEVAILEANAAEIAAQIGPHSRLIEFGSGASTRPLPAGGKNSRTCSGPGTLSNTSSQPAGKAASTECTAATGSPPPDDPPMPSWAARSVNPAASTVVSSAGNCQATPTSPKCRCAYSTATLVLPAPPSPYRTTTRGPRPSPPVSRVSTSSSRSSRPARKAGRGGSRTGLPGITLALAVSASAFTKPASLASPPSTRWPCR